MTEIVIPRAFQPLLSPKRFKVYYGGRGGAKSHNFARALLVLGMQKRQRILCARELQNSISDSVHKLLSDLIDQHDLHWFYTVQKQGIYGKNATEFLFKGLKHNATEIKSTEGVTICWVEEAEKTSDSSWEMLIPTIRMPESEIWISFNTKNITDPTHRRFVIEQNPDAHVQKVSWRDNPFFPEVLNKERIRLQQSDPEAYAHIWEGEPDLRRNGSIYAKWISKAREEGRISTVPHDPSVPVFTAWDLGRSDSTCIWFCQVVGKQPRIIDYIDASGEDLPYYAKLVRERPYNYTKHYLPHDAAHNRLGMNNTIEGQLRTLGLNVTVLPIGDVAAGISKVRMLLPQCWFDAQKTKRGIEALEAYQYQWDDTRQCFKPNPLHDWASDPSDAFRYLAQAIEKEGAKTLKPTTRPEPRQVGSWMGA